MWNKPKVLNWTANFLFSVAIVLALYAVMYVVLHLPIFPVREVKVEGELNHVNAEQVKLIVSKHLKGNFFTLNLQHTRDAFEKLPWARKVSIRRRWPDQIVVNIEEHKALARWGNIAMVNSHGELFQAASDDELPVFYGPGDGVEALTNGFEAYEKILGKANIKIQKLSLSTRRAWDITTDNGLQIALGRIEMEERLDRFVTAYNSSVAMKNAVWQYADLRYPNGFALRKKTGEAQLKLQMS